MSEKTKNLCAQIPESLHAKVRENQAESGKKLDVYMTWLITRFYEMEEHKMDNNTRTLAVQIPTDLFDRLEQHLETIGKKKKAFMIELLEKVLDEAGA